MKVKIGLGQDSHKFDFGNKKKQLVLAGGDLDKCSFSAVQMRKVLIASRPIS